MQVGLTLFFGFFECLTGFAIAPGEEQIPIEGEANNRIRIVYTLHLPNARIEQIEL